MRHLFFALFLILLYQSASAETTKTIYSPFTQKFDFITRIDTSTTYGFAAIQLVDSSNCLWSTTVNTSGSLVTSLVHCPSAGGFILQEDGTFILQEDSTKITVE